MSNSHHPKPQSWPSHFGPLLLHRRTLGAALLLAWSFEALVLLPEKRYLPALAVNTLIALIAFRAPARPLRSTLQLAAVLLLSAMPLDLLDPSPLYTGLTTATGTVACAFAVLHLVWARPARRAAPACAALALAELVSGYFCADPPLRPMVAFSALVLLLSAGTALYLRHEHSGMLTTPMRQLLSRQWPVIAVLSVSLYFELSRDASGYASAVFLLCSVVVSGLAVIAPLRPAETALMGVVPLVLTTVLLQITNADADLDFFVPIPPGALAGSMILMAFASRWAPPREASYAVGALLAAWAYAMVFTPGQLRSSLLVQAAVLAFMCAALAVGTGLYFRARDGERSRMVQSAVSEAQHSERMALARELHDVVAHHVTGIVVQAQAAQMVAAKNPQAAVEALERIAHSGTESLAAMRRLVSSMRGADPAGSSGAAEQATDDLEADLESLVTRVERMAAENGSAQRFELDVRLERQVPQEVARSALRLVQESMTNAEKHALDAALVHVSVRTSERHMHLRITDDGSGQRAQPVGGSGGYGLVGMRERVELIGGQFRAGPGERGGWRVEAWLPLELDDSEDA